MQELAEDHAPDLMTPPKLSGLIKGSLTSMSEDDLREIIELARQELVREVYLRIAIGLDVRHQALEPKSRKGCAPDKPPVVAIPGKTPSPSSGPGAGDLTKGHDVEVGS